MSAKMEETIEETMFKLAEDGDITEFKKNISKVNLLGNRDNNGETYLHRALSKAVGEKGYMMLSLINFIISKAPQLIEVRNSNGEFPICFACDKNIFSPIIKCLVQHTCASESEIITEIIQSAVESGCSFTVIELLLQKFKDCYDINSRFENGSTILIKYGKSYYNVCKILSYGADPNLVDNYGRSALYCSLDNEDPDAVQCLIEAGADPLAKIVNGCLFNNSNNPCNTITKVFQLAIQTDSNNFDSDIDSAEVNVNDKWLELYDFILKLPSIKDKTITDTYIQLLKDMYWYFYVGEELESVVEKTLILTTVNNNSAICNITEFLPKYRKFQEIDIKVDCIAFMLAHISQESFKARSHSRVYEFIDLMFKVGFSVNTCPENQPTALTTMLAYPEEESNLYSAARKDIIDRLIKSHVNVESMALSTMTSYFQIHYGSELNSYKIKLYLPDALVLALDTNEEVLKILLPYWWGPPLLLLIFHSKLQNVEVHDPEELNETLALVHEDVFSPWMKFLCNYGGIPHGTDMFNIAESLFVLWNDLATKSPYEKDFSIHYQSFKNVTCSPLSLQELCKYAVRCSFAGQASHANISLPQLLHQSLPPLLRPVVMH